MSYFWICLGAIVGATARYALSNYVAKTFSTTFPFGTLIINWRSLLLGFFLILSSKRVLVNPHWRFFVAIGFCGSYTTFSSYAFETFAYMEQAQWLVGAANIIASNVLCLAAALAGALARWL